MAVTTTGLVRYSVLPGIIPRIKELVGSGFGFMSSVMAVLYYNLGLLPKNHPYLDSRNYGRFGLVNVVTEARKNLVFSRQHIDQVILYFTILAGIVVLALQIVLLVFSLFSNPVFAGSLWWDYFLNSPEGPEQDIAFVVLDSVFGAMQESGTAGTTGFFESCISNTMVDCTDIRGNIVPSPSTFPEPMHLALHQMLAFYTMGIAFLSMAIILYYVVAIVGETVTTGTPFGQRLNKSWFIPRLIMFFALLAPISFSGNNNGINVAQLITFLVAKSGSNMATNAWLKFVDDGIAATATSEYGKFFGSGESMLALPNLPEMGTLAQFMYVVRMCMYAEKIVHGIDVAPFVVRPHSDDTKSVTLLDGSTVAYNEMGGTKDDYLLYFDGSSSAIYFYQAVEFSRYQDVVLRFGNLNPPGEDAAAYPPNPAGVHDNEWGFVKPICGEIKFELTSLDPFVVGPSPKGDIAIQDSYWYYIDNLLYYDDIFDYTTYCTLESTMPYDNDSTCIGESIQSESGSDPGKRSETIGGETIDIDVPLDDPADPSSPRDRTQALTVDNIRVSIEIANTINKALTLGQYMDWYNAGDSNSSAGTGINEYYNQMYEDSSYINNLIMPTEVRERGWAGAALWYNKIAEINGIYASAIQNMPRPFKYPEIMEEVARQHFAQDSNTDYTNRFNPRLADGRLADLPNSGDQYIAASLYSVYEFWSSSAAQETVFTKQSKNMIIDAINTILGTNGIFDILENEGVYPLAMLSSMGKSMVDAALRNLWYGVIGQGIGELMDGFIGNLANIGKSFAFRFGMIGLGIGFILYYVLPVLPFIYFFFAFGGWIKSIFEAVLAMPLWALAHLKLDGNGLPGPWATNGYFLLFEIFIRPILIIFGFVFSISMYAAMVDGVHNSYHLLVYVASGYDMEAEMNVSNYPSMRDISNYTGANGVNFMRGPVDEIFYTIIYVIIVYMIGLSCFKLVDTIPKSIMRWMGVTVSTFQDNAGDPAGQLTGRLFRGVQLTNMQILSLVGKAQGFKSANTDADAASMMG